MSHLISAVAETPVAAVSSFTPCAIVFADEPAAQVDEAEPRWPVTVRVSPTALPLVAVFAAAAALVAKVCWYAPRAVVATLSTLKDKV